MLNFVYEKPITVNAESNFEGIDSLKIELTHRNSCNTAFPKQGGICMSGSIYHRKTEGYSSSAGTIRPPKRNTRFIAIMAN